MMVPNEGLMAFLSGSELRSVAFSYPETRQFDARMDARLPPVGRSGPTRPTHVTSDGVAIDGW